MAQVKVGSTDPELLRRIAALRDNPAWGVFFERYNPLIRAWCSAYGLDAESVDELRQRVWVEMVRRMPTYQYDPGGSFRGWLRRLCHHRAIDLCRERRDLSFHTLDCGFIDKRCAEHDSNDAEIGAERLLLLAEAQEAQEEVRRKVKPLRWEVFWQVMIEGKSMTETATTLGIKYATAYAASNHVMQLLRAEGDRRRGRRGLDDPANPEKG
jgi:RNA polymerase sigma-70 factor, ECF subfamily